jgi:adenylosuccinate lyase
LSLEHTWAPLENVIIERQLWVTVMQEQRRLGLDIPDEAVKASDACVYQVDQVTLDRIDAQERIVRHDLKARLDVFCEDAGHQYHHLGLTSADIVDNVAQIKILRSLEYLRSMWELELEELIARYPMRGIKGAVGTQQDQIDLLESVRAARDLDRAVADRFGFRDVLGSVGQIYPRSLDFEVASVVSSALRSRLYARLDAEGIQGYLAVVGGYVLMLANLPQWGEGDVSSSVVRRVALPGLFLTAEDALRAAFGMPEP